MADFGSPIAQNVNPVGQGLTTLSDLMNVKRQQQALQTGVYQQQTAQAGAQQAQQQNQELQALAQFTKTAASDPAYHNPDGSLNVQKYQTDAMKAAPTYGQAYIGQMTSNANAMVDNRKALLGLSNDQRQTIGNYFGAVAAKPNATKEDFAEAAEQARGVSDDPAYQKAVDRMLMATPDTRMLSTAQASTAIQQHARGIAMETNAPDTAQSGPNVQMVQGPSGLVPTNVNPQSPGGIGPVGPTQQQGLPPTVVTGPSGVPTVIKGTSAGAAAGAGAGSGPTPTSEDWRNFGAYQANLNNRVAVATDSIPRIQEAEKALEQINSGHGSQGYAKLGQILQAAGAPQSLVDSVANGSLAASQEAEKYLFQTTFSGLRQAMQGDPARVAEFQSAEQVFPSIGTDPRASKAVLNFMVDQGKRDYAEQQALVKSRKEGTFNPATWQADYQQQLRAGKVPGVPSSQVPGGGKAMPTGARLKAYADKYTGGDLTKAQEALNAHGYQ